MNKIYRNNINFKNNFLFFIIFSFFLFVESFFHYYSTLIGYVFNYLGPLNYYGLKTGYNDFIWGENGLIETLQIILLLFSIYFITKFIYTISLKKKEKIFCCFYLFGLLYFFLEEISYGQHFFNWNSSDFFINFNNQKETNLHNISNLFDQLPRALLSIWVILPIFSLIFKIKYKYFLTKFILPSKKIRIISIYFLIFFLPNFITKKLNFYPEYTGHKQSIQSVDIYHFFTFNFIKLSEYSELIFCIFIFAHSLYLLNNNKFKV